MKHENHEENETAAPVSNDEGLHSIATTDEHIQQNEIEDTAHLIRHGRFTAVANGSFVIFLIGMRINKPLKVHKWWSAFQAMKRMLKELDRHPDIGLLSSSGWFGRTIIMVQYWQSLEQLLAYANNSDAEHFPAWRTFNRSIGASGDVGIWHETYLIQPGAYENVYVNMPLFGLGKSGTLHSATGNRQSAKMRIQSIHK